MALQVKSVVHQFPSDASSSLEGPIAAYFFWKQRCDDLQGLFLQVNSEGLNLSIPIRIQTQSLSSNSQWHIKSLPGAITACGYYDSTTCCYFSGVQGILALLERAGSCYLHEFWGVSRSLKGERDVATRNMHALSILVDSCTALSRSAVQVRHIV